MLYIITSQKNWTYTDNKFVFTEGEITVEPNDSNYQGLEANSVSAFPAETPLAMAYVPFQKIHYVYDPDSALMQGTLFPELDKPFLGGRMGMKKMADPNANAQMQSNYNEKVNTDILSGATGPNTGTSPWKGYDK
jgi:hypothetical protein